MYLCGDTAQDLNYEHQGQAEYGLWQEGGYRKGAETGTWGEYSTISRENNVCNNSREIKDFIKNHIIPGPSKVCALEVTKRAYMVHALRSD